MSRRALVLAGLLGIVLSGIPAARAQVGCAAGPFGCGVNPAEQAQRRMQLQTEIQRQEFTARQQGLRAIERDRAQLDALRRQQETAPDATTPPDRQRQKQALQADIDRQTAAMRGHFTAQRTGPGSWTIQNGQGAPQAACREVGSVLVC
ncbi:conserved hypothetical protein [Gluconacetobacter diazotrophicus PA1 5]|uniref:Uncharacterized protein n=2 Tax=Gluconacetobacter diazotrophicus TaxID=33996 RepID=A9HN36_GLUDA|nr:hypothetical protein [Gluconacetobacter diazotrophicus]ACI50483.1 conserved hypothetical protein [Gluconacetobacter diazotrophicus PA1 5]MBB2155678.1 hypothetical protein [Gluconacetobacter diazotrophicus]TWB02785.1 hypothetical protein FBZ86_12630 [Gluconacetobacter diazotrophicus]CAP56387.1 hypothetical protein GDI2444 [Gluconacetobacter diazotrophicus PA1 5]